MTTPNAALADENPFERWPGYDEQSWRERFVELDRRHRDLRDHFIESVMKAAALRQPSSVSDEVVERVAKAIGDVAIQDPLIGLTTISGVIGLEYRKAAARKALLAALPLDEVSDESRS
jgi:hypothetical protein